VARPSARENILDCAERLFAEHGLEGVSLRAINADAGLSPAALHYHFGTKEALVAALLERRMPALMERRRHLLDQLESRTEPATTRDVLDALIRPQAELLAKGGESGLRYLRLIHRLQADGDLDPRFVIERYRGGVDRLMPLFRQALPSLSAPLIQLRMGLAIDIMLRSLATGAASRGDSLEAQVRALLDFLTGAMEAPVTGESR
jgi:AcrR family transcriptional regulator